MEMEQLKDKIAALEAARAAETERLLALREAIETSDGVTARAWKPFLALPRYRPTLAEACVWHRRRTCSTSWERRVVVVRGLPHFSTH